MKGDGTVRVKALLAAAGKYKYVLLVILAGVVLLLLPTSGKSSPKAEAQQPEAFQADTADKIERKLEDALSQVEGAGKVTVVLTLKSSGRQILAQDRTSSEKDGGTDSTVTTVVVSKGSGVEETVPLQQLSPEFQGALVVCSGGNDPSVRLELVKAVSALTGLGTDRITVCKGK